MGSGPKKNMKIGQCNMKALEDGHGCVMIAVVVQKPGEQLEMLADLDPVELIMSVGAWIRASQGKPELSDDLDEDVIRAWLL